MRFEVLRRVLASRRKSLLGWTISLVLLMLLMALAYPSVKDQQSFTDLIKDYPEFVQQILGLGSGLEITSPAGYLNSQVYTNTLPLLFLIFLIGFAVKETATEEREGMMNLLLAHPVTRTRVLMEKFSAMAIAGLYLAAVSAVSLMIFGPIFELTLSLAGYAGATLATLMIGLVFGTLAMAVGAATGSRVATIAVSSGLAVVFFVFWGLAPFIGAVEFTNYLNPFYWAFAGDPILHGIQAGNFLGLLVAVVVLAAVGAWAFNRRDIGV